MMTSPTRWGLRDWSSSSSHRPHRMHLSPCARRWVYPGRKASLKDVRRALGPTSPQVGSLFETADDARDTLSEHHTVGARSGAYRRIIEEQGFNPPRSQTGLAARVESEEQAWASVPAYPNSRPPPELQRRDAMADPLTRRAKP